MADSAVNEEAVWWIFEALPQTGRPDSGNSNLGKAKIACLVSRLPGYQLANYQIGLITKMAKLEGAL